MLSSGKILSVSFSLLLLFSIFFPSPAHCEGDPIAHLTNFTGTVLINSRGSWGVKPEKGFPLYSMDKIVTRVGTAVITFADGAVIEIKNNSNLLINEMEKEEGLVKKAKIVQRRILLFIGKMFFKTGTGNVQTQFETEKTVIGIRGTAGVLSIGPDGEIYIEFSEGHEKFTVGDMIKGIAKDVPKELVDQNPIQKAAYLANAAWERCLEAREKAACGADAKFIPKGSQSLGVYEGSFSGDMYGGSLRICLSQTPEEEKLFAATLDRDTKDPTVLQSYFARGKMTANSLEGKIQGQGSGTLTGQLSSDRSRLTGSFNVTAPDLCNGTWQAHSISTVQMEWACAYAREMSAKESQTYAMALIKNNPSEEVVAWAEEILEEANLEIEKAKEDQQMYIDLGAVPEILVYTPPGAEGEVEGY